MEIDCLPVNGLGPRDWEAWEAIVAAAPDLQSPYFSAAFCRIVAACSGDVWVGRLRSGAETVGFFPFHRRRFGAALPLARGLSDQHGVVGSGGLELDPRALLRACGVKAFEFHHLLAAQRAFRPFSIAESKSPIVNLRGGYAVYRQDIERQSAVLSKTEASRSRLSREVGTVRVELDGRDPGLLQVLQRWKSAQYRRTGGRDIFVDRWTREVVAHLSRSREPGCVGMLSVLWAGDRQVALHFGMRSADVLHYWFPAYDPQYARYSPGLILLAELVRWAANLGLRMIDLGKGDAAYKTRLSNGAIALLEGRVERPSAIAAWRRARRLIARIADRQGERL